MRQISERILGSFLWPFTQRFIAGKITTSVIMEAEWLNSLGFKPIINYLGENLRSRWDTTETEGVYCSLVKKIANGHLSGAGSISIKLSQFGYRLTSDMNRNLRKEFYGLNGFLIKACEYKVPVWFDAELLSSRFDVWYLVWKLLNSEFDFAGIELQAYGAGDFDSVTFFKDEVNTLIHRLPRNKLLGVRLCEGAYADKYALKDRKEIRKRYLELVNLAFGLLLESGRDNLCGLYPEFATNDTELIERIQTAARKRGISKYLFRFTLSYGRRRSYAAYLVSQGYNVAIYLPFGERWSSYILRRIKENPLRLFFGEGSYGHCKHNRIVDFDN